MCAASTNKVPGATRRQVHTITDRFSMANTYIINDEKLIVVDPGSEINVHVLCSYLQYFLHRTIADVDLIVLTHLHPDHTAGVEALHRICTAPIAASATAQRLAQAEEQGMSVLPTLTHIAGQVMPESLQLLDLFPPAYVYQAKLINIWLEDVAGLPLHPAWRVIASPGHTPDSLCLYNPFTCELLCGDTVIAIEGGMPLLRAGMQRTRAEEMLRVLRSLEVRYLYPGHGRPILAQVPLAHVEIE